MTDQPTDTSGRVSRMAIASLVLVFISLIAVVIFRYLLILVAFILALISFGMGIVALVRIQKSGGRLIGRKVAVASMVLSFFLVVVLVIIPALARVRGVAFRMACGTNLSGIGRAMLLYANDYDDELPKAGGRESTWVASLPDWQGSKRTEAFGIDNRNKGGFSTIGSHLYLVVKYMEIEPKQFLCLRNTEATLFDPRSYGLKIGDLSELWDFGPDPSQHYSFSYHHPFGNFALTTKHNQQLPIMAERTPWIRNPVGLIKEFDYFKPEGEPWNGSLKQTQYGNSFNHENEGQNVLYLDSHTAFEKRSYVGINEDNIYTVQDGNDVRRGLAPKAFISKPAHENDSLLLSDPPVD